MPAKKSKGTVAKKKPSHGGKPKVSKANKTKTKATKRKTQMKKRKDKRAQKQRKERKKADKAKRTAKKKAKTKKTKKSKDKKKKKAPKKPAPAKEKADQEPPSEDGDDEEGEDALHMRLAGMTVNQMQNLRTTVVELSKDEFLEQLRDHGEHQREQRAFEAAYMTTAENRTKLFYDSERPTDASAGPFQSNRFGAVFLISGQQ
ncbi:hypothetical protein GCK72_011972 [Caenorhabditis remanei]|uniref:Uncharacterized protein n=1 Tax=Caenorhabditis remanei TaxID=31234 RepID=A0A6A5GLZ2_CAERE|nr:hypothetical protein GCK72_011972 [Caenorhabditis remanei]KAF1755522.1 hypothetical protein GCK72_011972 [Caenorhabditis remanei]